MVDEPLLDIRNLRTSFDTRRGKLRAVDEVEMEIHQGESVALVGESGSGKSVTAKSVMGLVEDQGIIDEGIVKYKSQDLTELTEEEFYNIRGNEISMIFQHPMTALNPTMTVGKQIARVIRIHDNRFQESSSFFLVRGGVREAIREEVIDLLNRVEIPDPEARFDQYPHQMSGGMKQRVLIAMALASDPDLLIADEPTTALDVTVETKIFNLVTDLIEEYDISLWLITHDLGVVAHTCETVYIMYAGEIVEKGSVYEIFDDPKHPYTRELLKSLPTTSEPGEQLHTIEGQVPDPTRVPSGCRFHPRCPEGWEECTKIHPKNREFDGRRTRCLLYDEEGVEINEQQ
jgi:oligopeptide/dipeptide ABC transporter ATP-binding protein